MTGPSISQMMGHIHRKEAFTEPYVRKNVTPVQAKMLKSVHAFLNRYWTAEPYGLEAVLWRPGKHWVGGTRA